MGDRSSVSVTVLRQHVRPFLDLGYQQQPPWDPNTRTSVPTTAATSHTVTLWADEVNDGGWPDVMDLTGAVFIAEHEAGDAYPAGTYASDGHTVVHRSTPEGRPLLEIPLGRAPDGIPNLIEFLTVHTSASITLRLAPKALHRNLLATQSFLHQVQTLADKYWPEPDPPPDSIRTRKKPSENT